MTKDILAEGKRKILEALESKKRKPSKDRLMSFSSLLDETGLSKSVLSNHIKDLQKRELIKRDIDTRRYYLTEKGEETTVKQRILTMVIEYFLREPGETEVNLKPIELTDFGESPSLELKSFSEFLGTSYRYLINEFSGEVPEELPERLRIKIHKSDSKVVVEFGD